MIKPPTPADEQSRLLRLRALDLLDTNPDERFDRLTRMAQRLFDVPIALVSLVDTDRQWFKSRQGLDADETPRDISFCGHTILGDETMVIPNAPLDERFCNNPLVVNDPDIRFYAGCPVRAPDGSRIGTFCIIDRRPRELSREDKTMLRDLAKMVEREIASIELATIDELTGLTNRRGFKIIGTQALAACRRAERPASMLAVDLDHFKEINDRHGHATGDWALVEMAGILKSIYRESDLIARLGGDEFCALLTGTGPEHLGRPLAVLQDRVNRWNSDTRMPFRLEYSAGVVAFDPERHTTVECLLRDADSEMYVQKRQARRSAAG
jgi:diguanylate cyclase (GGDEF)-like protein